MIKSDFTKFANDNPICYFATTENDQPRVRALGFWFGDDSGFYFQTSSRFDFYKQLNVNPKVEVCFYAPEGLIGTMMRIAGEIEFLDDLELKARAINERPFLKELGLTPESKGLIVFRIPHGEAHFWTMETSNNPKEIFKF